MQVETIPTIPRHHRLLPKWQPPFSKPRSSLSAYPSSPCYQRKLGWLVRKTKFSPIVSVLYWISSSIPISPKNIKLNCVLPSQRQRWKGCRPASLSEHNIEQRKICDWNWVTFSRFRWSHETSKGTSACLKYIFVHYEDVLDYIRNDQLLLQHLRDIFRNEQWCKTLFENSERDHTVSALAELLKKALSNNNRSKTGQSGSSTTTCPVKAEHSFPNLVASFSSKVLPPPSHQRSLGFHLSNHMHWQRPWNSDRSENRWFITARLPRNAAGSLAPTVYLLANRKVTYSASFRKSTRPSVNSTTSERLVLPPLW